MKHKRLYSFILAAILILSIPLSGSAESPVTGLPYTKAYGVYDLATGNLLYGENTTSELNVAGLNKLPSLLLICETVDIGMLSESEKVTVSLKASQVPGPTSFIAEGESIQADALIKSSVMITAGDAIYALAEALSGSATVFSRSLTERMSELGLDISFQEVFDTTKLMSCDDLSKLCIALSKSKTYMKYSSIYNDSIMHQNNSKTDLTSSNRLLKSYPGCIGLATGSSPEAGYSGAFLVNRNDMMLLCVVIGAKNADDRASAATELLNYAYATYQYSTFVKKDEVVAGMIKVKGGSEKFIDLVAAEDSVMLYPKNETYTVIKPELPDSLVAPIAEGTVFGSIQIKDDAGNIMDEISVISSKNITQAVFADYFNELTVFWIHG